MNMRSRLLTASLLVGLSTGAACGGSSTAPTPPPSNTPTINIVGQNGIQAFSPNPSSFGGQAVVFRNNDSVTHRVILHDGGVDTGDIAPGATSRTVTMPSTGTNYHCSIHPGMIGSVAGASGAPPPCEGDYCVGY